MTTTKAVPIIYLVGTGEATIDWGGVTETKTLGGLTSYISPVGMPAGSSSKTIKITAKNGITELICNTTGLTALDVSNNPGLTRLHCHDNPGLSVLDLSKNTALLNLNCYRTGLSVLDLSKNTKLTWLDCHVNNLSVLDLSKNLDLDYLYCGQNALTGLDVRMNVKLTYLDCRNCNLTEAQLNALFNTLNDVDSDDKVINFAQGNPGAAACDKTILTAKHWTE